MRWFYTIRLRVRTLLRRDRVEDDLADEIRDHLDRRAAELAAAGMSERDARDAALRAFGGVEQRKEECRDMRRLGVLEDLLQDLRYALRMLRRSPGFATVAILSLALGIGANTAIFSAIDSVMLRPLPVAGPEQLLMLQWSAPAFPEPFARSLEGGGRSAPGGRGADVFPHATFSELRRRGDVFSTVMAFTGDAAEANIGLGAAAESARVIGVSGNYFSGLAVPAFLGRTLTDEDAAEGADPVVVASHAFWQTRLGAVPGAVGQRIFINGQPVTIAGVAPPDFFGLEPGLAPDLWVSLAQYARQAPRRSAPSPSAQPAQVPYLTDATIWWLRIVGRLKPGTPVERAQAAAAVAFSQSIGAAGHMPPEANTPKLTVVAIARGIDSMRQALSQPLMLLMSMVGLILLVTCANLAGLLLERASARKREIAVRLSLGVRRSRLIRQLLTESVTLSVAGGIAALVATAWTYPLLMSLLSDGPLPSHLQFSLDARVLAFTAAVAIGAGILFGLAPAVHASRVRLLGNLTQRTLTPAARRGLTPGKALVCAQIAISLVLVVGAGLFMRTLQQLHAVELGFNRDNLLLFTVQPGLNGYASDALVSYYAELTQRIVSTPGVVSATVARRPAIGGGSGSSSAVISGSAAAPGRVDVYRHEVGSRYFDTLGIRLLAGRAIDERDTPTSAKVAAVNETLVKMHFGDRNPIGEHIDFGTPNAPRPFQIIGVVKDAKYDGLRDAVPPTVYLSYLQFFGVANSATFIVRTSGPPAMMVPAMQRAARAVAGGVPVMNVRSQLEAIDGTLSMERTFATFSTCLGLLALVLAAVGLYGTLAYAVARRTNEIGIRMALGATRAATLGVVLKDSFVIVCAGIAIGIPAAFGAARLISGRLYGVTPTDPATVAAAVLVLSGVAAVAAFLPAHRASRVDPATALRAD